MPALGHKAASSLTGTVCCSVLGILCVFLNLTFTATLGGRFTLPAFRGEDEAQHCRGLTAHIHSFTPSFVHSVAKSHFLGAWFG